MTTVHDLSVNIADAVTEAKNILQQMIEYPINVWVSGVAVCSNNKRVTGGTSRITLYSFRPHRLDCFHEELENQLIYRCVDEGVSVNICTLKLNIHRRLPCQKLCPGCSCMIANRYYTGHVETCAGSDNTTYCEICQQFLQIADIADHRETCCNKNFPCRVCNKAFATPGNRRTHELICRQNSAGSSTEGGRSKEDDASNQDLNEGRKAIGGLFRVISLDGDQRSGSDFEGSLNDFHERISRIITRYRDNGVRVNLVARLRMKKLVEDDCSEAFFMSPPSIYLKASDIDNGISEQINTIGLPPFTVIITFY